ncbi:DUF58 domain-containing protein [Cupriavidus oxalaticus]|uniref:DUF58 domain-containing protein n=1 Tax=Cupriavidus oxalaticus TaxID=96344 RepID=A0A976BDF3_9BURK|nr:DUF58 domain-containing protein [Cupriavidus oxalaticus]QRQ87875.1 DUF58 domain-containing protein [Cupriavidus oxalaticus]QRQ93798.1 DUF58 domain-containing protein [Cupriavidus oxalaticus]WQD82426.1 DUF58 domain-containing protein [Cupriavidus oxalaticus]SPC14890.1 conserved hypothetical protein [Cupriavidus oxalaticus]
MRSHLASLARSPVPAGPGQATRAQPGVSVDAAALAALEVAARDFHFLPRQPVHSVLAGRHASRVRGRGLTFEEVRGYLPGDDIRSMDWRVTARTGKPHVRVYSEEKDRPVLLLVDQRINMFFGSRRAMKSVVAAEAAALAAWRVLSEGDRVGGLVFGDGGCTELAPRRSRQAVEHLLGEIARHNQALRADAPARRGAGQLNAALERAARLARHDHLVIVISDFDGHDAATRDLMLSMSARNDLLTMLVYDPFLLELPDSGHLVVSDGELQVELGFGQASTRKGIAEFVDAQSRDLLGWHRAIGVPLLPLSAAEETPLQLRRLLGQALPQGQGTLRARQGGRP